MYIKNYQEYCSRVRAVVEASQNEANEEDPEAADEEPESIDEAEPDNEQSHVSAAALGSVRSQAADDEEQK